MNQDRDGLEGMAHNKGSLGVAAGLLMEALTHGIFFPSLGRLRPSTSTTAQ